MNSLQGRLSAGLVVTLLAVFLLQGVAVSLFLRHMTEDYIASRLEHDAESLLSALHFLSDGSVMLDSARTDPIYQRPYSGHYYRIETARQLLRSRSLWDQDMSVAPLAVGAFRRITLRGPERQPLLIVARGYRKAGEDLTIAVAEDLGLIEQTVRHFQWLYLLLSLGVVSGLILLQRLLVRRSLRPLAQVRTDIASLERGEIAALPEQVPTELVPLTREINRLLGAFADRLVRSRNALGNLAHALKAPLSLLTQLADDPALKAAPHLADRLAAPLDTMRNLIERELKRARLAGGSVPGRRFTPEQEIPPLLEVLRRIYHDKELAFDCRITPGMTISADREDMLELLGNLLDNACKWCRRQIRITVDCQQGPHLRVEDDGPGCTPEQLTNLTERGVRIDESIAGHGLGLAIACDIVTGYAGRMQFDRSADLGGLSVDVLLAPPRDSTDATCPAR
jgi:signal transduction histidine kinase